MEIRETHLARLRGATRRIWRRKRRGGAPRCFVRASEPASMGGRHPIFSEWAELPPAFPDGAVALWGDGCGNSLPIHSLAQISSGDRAGAPDSCTRARSASVREALVAKYGRGPESELGLRVWWHLIAEELGKDPGS